MAAGWPLQGRDEEVAVALAALESGRAGVLLAGEAGVGKSRLAEEVGARLAADGRYVARLAGSSAASGLPLAAVAPLLPAAPADAGLPALVLLRQALAGAADDRPISLVLDDAHLLDDASAMLVHQLVLGGEVTVVATQRSGTVAPDAIARMWWDHMVDRVEVRPLDREAADALAASIAGRALGAEQSDRLWRLSEGNPLFVRELLLAGAVVGSEEGHEGDVGVAPRLVDLVERRLAGLDDADREALRHIAFGEPLGPGELERVAASSTVVTLERAGLIAAEEDGRRLVVRVVHPLHSEVLRAQTAPEERRAILYRLAEALHATGARRRGDGVRLASWSVDSGLAIPPAELAAAARVARFSSDIDLARRLAEEAFGREPTFGHGEILTDILYEDGDVPSLLAHLDRWEALAADDAELGAVGVARAVAQYWRVGDEAASTAALDTVAALAPSPWTEEGEGVRALLLAFAGRPVEALTRARPLLSGPPGRPGIQAAVAASQALRTQGRPVAALAVVEEALVAYRDLGEQALLVSSRVLGSARMVDLVDAGRFAEAEAEGERTGRLVREAGDQGDPGLAALVEGWLRLQQGQLSAASSALDSAMRAFELVRHWGMRRWAQASFAMVRAMAGDGPAARRALAAVDERDHPARAFESAVHRARAWLAWLDGDSPAAYTVLRQGAEELRATGDVYGAIFCLHDLARLGCPEEAVGPLTAVAGEIDGDLLPLLVRHVAALAAGSAEELGAVADAFAELGAWLLASEAAASADGAAREEGDSRASAAHARHAETWRARCEGVAWLGPATTDGPVPLTRREREIAGLAARGLTSREVAEQLYVSARTVESHLARAYAKLGIRSRAELADLLAGDVEAGVG